eukprot:52875_1
MELTILQSTPTNPSISRPSHLQKQNKSPSKRARKPRVINNSIVDLDDVSIGPGTDMKDWLHIAKQKLRKREIILTRQRLRIVDNIIISAFEEFIRSNTSSFDLLKQVTNISTDHLSSLYKQEIRSELCQAMNRYINSMTIVLSKWTTSTRASSSFRKYFQTIRRSSDVKKTPVMALECWIPIMQMVEEFSKKAAARFSWDHDIELQRLYTDTLHTSILIALCEGMIKPANTRELSLIPSMAYHVFLSRYNYYLQIAVSDQFVPHQHKLIRKQYLECLRTKNQLLSESFQNKLMCFYEEKAAQNNVYASAQELAQLQPTDFSHCICSQWN